MLEVQKDQAKILLITGLTEFAERYSYYVIQALLIFLLIEKFHFTQSISAELVGTILSMVYVSAIIGGYIADKLIGYYKAAYFGSFLMLIGTIILSISHTENILFIGLAFISISSGLIKSNISSFLGNFYDLSKLSQSNRDFGFNIFYVGINLGSLFALFFASTLKDKYGFSAPFYSSVFVALLMILNMSIGFNKLKNYIRYDKISLKKTCTTAGIVFGYIALVFYILKNPFIANTAIFAASVLCLIVLAKSASVNGWVKPLIALFFFFLSILYWSLFFQIFISILLFTDKSVTHQIFFFSITNSQFLSVESFGVILLGAVMGKIWLYREKINKTVHDIDKFNLGFILLALTFVGFYLATIMGASDAKVPAWVFVLGYITLAVSELSLSAIGLSFITKIAPSGFVSLYMGIWLVTLGIGGKLAGSLSKHIAINDDIVSSKINMAHGFLVFIAIAVVAILLCLLLRKIIIRTFPQ